VGKTKERYIAEGIAKYLRLLRPFASVDIVETKEQKGKASDVAIRKEGEGILRKTSSYILFDERGREVSSVEFASILKDRAQVDFVLGGAYGVSDDVKNAASDIVALSRMTLTHEMARLLLLEQIYRAMTINRGGGYHH
jgi:23S rRNA (pseudouridine1915-N3)-methyltransferase